MYPIGKSICLTDSGRSLTLAEVIMGGDSSHKDDPVVVLSSQLTHHPLFHFVIVESTNGAFQSSDFFKPWELSLQYYQQPANWLSLQRNILGNFPTRFRNPRDLEWIMRTILWEGKAGMGVALSIVCGSEVALELCHEVLEETV